MIIASCIKPNTINVLTSGSYLTALKPSQNFNTYFVKKEEIEFQRNISQRKLNLEDYS